MTTSTDDRQTRAGAEPIAAAPPDAAPLGPSEAAPIPDDALIILPVRNVVLFPGVVLPLALGREEAGREIEGPMAVVILGGLITSTLLNLLVLPTLALRFGRFRKPDAELDLDAAG